MQLIRPTDIPPNALGDTDAVLTASNVATDDAPEYNNSTSYSIGDQVIVLGTTQRLYEALQASTGSFPPDNPTDWNDLGAINRWKMFDGGTNTQTSNPDSIEVTLDPEGVTNSFSLFNINGAEVQVTLTDPVEGVVFDKTYNLIDNTTVVNWYSYFFEPIARITQLTDLSLPAYKGATVDIALTETGADVDFGLAVIGQQAEIGTTVFGTSVGIRDFSRKEVDEFGNFTIVERRFFRTADYDVRIDTPKVAFVQKILSDRRAKPTVYIGTEDNPETIVYGYYRDFDIVLSNPAVSNGTIEVEGL